MSRRLQAPFWQNLMGPTAVRCLIHCSYCCPSSVRLRVRSCHAPRVAGACSVVGGPAAACARCSLSTAWEALLLELWEAA